MLVVIRGEIDTVGHLFVPLYQATFSGVLYIVVVSPLYILHTHGLLNTLMCNGSK